MNISLKIFGALTIMLASATTQAAAINVVDTCEGAVNEAQCYCDQVPGRCQPADGSGNGIYGYVVGRGTGVSPDFCDRLAFKEAGQIAVNDSDSNGRSECIRQFGGGLISWGNGEMSRLELCVTLSGPSGELSKKASTSIKKLYQCRNPY